MGGEHRAHTQVRDGYTFFQLQFLILFINVFKTLLGNVFPNVYVCLQGVMIYKHCMQNPNLKLYPSKGTNK